MARRSVCVPLLAMLVLLALGQETVGAQTPVDCSPGSCTFGHDDTLDGTPGEIVSGFGGSGDPALQPAAQRTPGTYEFYEVAVPPGSYGSFTVDLTWQDPRLDFDLYLYRRQPNGLYETIEVRSSAAGGTDRESVTYFPPIGSDPLPTGQVFGIIVENWCTTEADPDPAGDCQAIGAPGAADDPPDEDDFTGAITFAGFQSDNQAPTVSVTGPDRGTVGQLLRFGATASDADGVTGYAFDLDGDGRFETDTLQSPSVARRFDAPGTYNVGVRATDTRGAAGYASKPVTITGAPLDELGRPRTTTIPSKRIIDQLALSGPVFGGRRSRNLAVRYRLRERATVELTLLRGGRTVRRLVRRSSRQGDRTYRLTVRPRGLRRGLYTLRMTARTADGRTQTTRVSARRL